RTFRTEIRGYRGYNPDFGKQNVYRYQEHFVNPKEMQRYFGKIPFLNGGLFECLDDKATGRYLDGFTDIKKYQPKLPNFLFFSEQQIADLNAIYGTKNKQYKVQGLIDILSSFNFTIDENVPDDQDVALDPELLGKVFENLLASFNPETATTARKATGSYYTPREIVDYMVTESLKAYFKAHCAHLHTVDNRLDALFSRTNEENPFDRQESKEMVKLIGNLRIVDPAVGSGAFPMGALNKLVFILSKLDPHSILWKEAQIKAVEANVPDPLVQRELKKHIEKQFSEKNLDYGRKLYLIQKCIYGVDIQQIAVEIAKLRFFIALLVDASIDTTKDNWDIQALPNLDFKIMQGNSLISEFLGIDFDNLKPQTHGTFDFISFDKEAALVKEFEQTKISFQYESERDKKEELREEVEELMIRILEERLKKKYADFEQIEKRAERIPNPKAREEYTRVEKEKFSKKHGFNLTEIEKQLKEFTSKQKIRPFFPWKLYFAEVFAEKGGFDIVLANPPYVRQEAIKNLKPLFEKAGFKVYNATSDLYTYFYELSYNILALNGVSCFISSNKWMRAKYGKNLRRFFKERTTVRNLIDFGGHKVFTATVDTNILLFQKKKPEREYKLPYASISTDFTGNDLTCYIKQKQAELTQENLPIDSGWTLAGEKILQLKEKIKQMGKPLKDWDVNIYRGITTGLNKVFIIDEKTKNELVRKDKKSLEILKPILRGRDVDKWYYRFKKFYLIYAYTGIDITRYEAIYEYLKQYKSELEQVWEAKYDKKKWYELRGCDYYEQFEKEKIVWQEISEKGAYQYDASKYYITNTAYILVGNYIKYLISVLNSNVCDFFFSQISSSLSIKGARHIKQYVEQLPIPIIPEKDQQLFIDLVNQILAVTQDPDYLQNLTKQAHVKDLEHQIDQMVYNLYNLTKEEIKIVESLLAR
ncbi:Eco57I restriction-modification methylase domain-containing protein, partial [Candidatus Aerophobetes bacterium]|nr:Eco57I restriction-modification methylase domain-containing protein [Candidatus Aerophobetes bacterium]